jgi:RNA polymerase sigma-70 factor (ECF subfamily)
MSEEHDRKLEFAEYLRRHQAQVYGYIHVLVRDLNDADDLFQQTVTILWKKFDEYERQRSFLSWACGVARFEIANFLRARSRHRLYFSDELNLALVEAQEALPPDELEERRAALAQCLRKLRERDRKLLEACYADEDVSAVAQRAGRSPQSVYNSLRRIRRALFECILRTLAQQSRVEAI